MSLYYRIQENKPKWYAITGIVCILVLIFINSNFWHGFASGALLIVVLYFIGFLFKTVIKNRKSDK